MLNRITITGRLCADPELRQTPANISVCSLRIACTRDFKREGEEKPASDFFDATAWRATGEFIARNFTKGRVITLDGRMETRNWTDKEGKKRTSYEINVDNAYFGDSKPADAPPSDGHTGGYGSYPDPSQYAGSVPDDFQPDF